MNTSFSNHLRLTKTKKTDIPFLLGRNPRNCCLQNLSSRTSRSATQLTEVPDSSHTGLWVFDMSSKTAVGPLASCNASCSFPFHFNSHFLVSVFSGVFDTSHFSSGAFLLPLACLFPIHHPHRKTVTGPRETLRQIQRGHLPGWPPAHLPRGPRRPRGAGPAPGQAAALCGALPHTMWRQAGSEREEEKVPGGDFFWPANL